MASAMRRFTYGAGSSAAWTWPKALEAENTKLKRMLAEAMPDIEGLEVVARGKF